MAGADSEGIYGLPEVMTSSSGHICNHRVLCTMYLVRQEYSEGLDNMDLRYLPLSPTAAPMVLCQNSVCASLDALDLVRLHLILGMPSP